MRGGRISGLPRRCPLFADIADLVRPDQRVFESYLFTVYAGSPPTLS